MSTCPAESVNRVALVQAPLYFWEQHTREDLENGVVEQLRVIRNIGESSIHCNRQIAPSTELFVGSP